MKSKPLQTAALILLACLLLAGIGAIVRTRGGQSDTYPPFSSYRTLPQGTSILFDALGHTAGARASRNVQSLAAFHATGAAILILNIDPLSVSADTAWFKQMEKLAATGNRVVIAFSPDRNKTFPPEQKEIDKALAPWNLRLGYVIAEAKDDDNADFSKDWGMYFSGYQGWTVLDRSDPDHFVIEIERTFGKGSIALVTNPYPFSNAAMVEKDRDTETIAGLLGPAKHVIFDETHFGMEEAGSVAGLARHYRLQGLVLGLLIVTALFIWKSSAGFPPPTEIQSAPVTGEDASAAFINLLRRNIPRNQIIPISLAEWRKLNERRSGRELDAAIDMAEAGRKSPVEAYAQIQKLLGAKHK